MAATYHTSQSQANIILAPWPPEALDRFQPRSPANRPLLESVFSSMTRSIQSPIESSTQADATSLVKALAPEDIRTGDFVTPLHEVLEFPSFFWLADSSLMPPDELVRLQIVSRGGGVPLKVKSVCLPFVLVKSPSGRQRTLDLRSFRLARLDREFAAKAWKARRNERAKKKSKK